MPKPPTSVRSIRLPDEVWAKLAERAAGAKLSINAYVAKAVEGALLDRSKRERQVAETEPYQRSGNAVLANLELIQRKPFNPQPKKGKK